MPMVLYHAAQEEITLLCQDAKTGIYNITFSATYPNSNYIIMVTALGAFVSPVLGGGTETTSSKTTVYTFGTDCVFFFTVF